MPHRLTPHRLPRARLPHLSHLFVMKPEQLRPILDAVPSAPHHKHRLRVILPLGHCARERPLHKITQRGSLCAHHHGARRPRASHERARAIGTAHAGLPRSCVRERLVERTRTPRTITQRELWVCARVICEHVDADAVTERLSKAVAVEGFTPTLLVVLHAEELERELRRRRTERHVAHVPGLC